MNEIIKNALMSIGIPNYYITRGDNKPDCIVYNYNSYPSYYADNTIKGNNYTILVNIYVNTNVEKMKTRVINAMIDAGFQGGQAQPTFEEGDNDNTWYNTAISFNRYLDK